MSDQADTLETDRSAREAALGKLRGHFEKFRAKPVKERVADDLARKARDVSREAAEIVADSKPVIAGTLGALALWFLRKPLLGGARRAWPMLKNRFSRNEEQ